MSKRRNIKYLSANIALSGGLKSEEFVNNINSIDEKKQENNIVYQFNNSYEKINDYSFAEATEKDKRGFFIMYKDYLTDKQFIMNLIFAPFFLEIRTITVISFLFQVALEAMLNAFFYSDEYIENTYQNGFNFFGDIPKTIYSFLVAFCISWLLDFLASHKDSFENNLECLGQGISKKAFEDRITQSLKCYRVKLIFYFILVYLLLIGFWYYTSSFCSVYVNTAKFWALSLGESLILSLALPFVLCFIPTILRFISLKCNFELLYNINKIVGKFI